MIRTLLIITGASLVLCAAAAAGAAALGADDLAHNNWTWTFRDDDEDHTVHFERGDDGPAVTRQLTWTGGDQLKIDIPGDVIYVQGSTPSVVVTGQKSMIDRVRLVDGRLTYDDGDDVDRVVFGWNVRDRLKVVVTAPSVRTFQLDSSADLSIRDYDQPTMALTVSGSGDVEGAGKTGTVTVDVSGSGDVDLAALEANDADVDISGSGDVQIAAAGAAKVDISGSGDVDFARRPAKLEQNISGSGDLSQN